MGRVSSRYMKGSEILLLLSLYPSCKILMYLLGLADMQIIFVNIAQYLFIVLKLISLHLFLVPHIYICVVCLVTNFIYSFCQVFYEHFPRNLQFVQCLLGNNITHIFQSKLWNSYDAHTLSEFSCEIGVLDVT